MTQRPLRSFLRNGEKGFTILELICVLFLTSILLGFASFYFNALENPADNGASALMGFMKKVRAQALASTSAYTIKASSPTQIYTTTADSCTSATQQNDPNFTLSLPQGAQLQSTTWSICYDPRGLSDTSADIVVVDSEKTKIVQAVLGGAVRTI